MSNSDEQVTFPVPETTNPWRKLLVELGPIVIFVAVNRLADIYWATGAFMAAIAFSMIYSWRVARHIPPMLWVTGVLVMLFGSMTIAFQNELWVKIKPTIINLIFATVLFAGLILRRPILKMLLQAAFPPMTEKGWRILTINWALFFIFLAGVNEVVWRNFSTTFWADFKLWGMMPLTLLFTLSQVPVMMKHLAEKPSEGKE